MLTSVVVAYRTMTRALRKSAVLSPAQASSHRWHLFTTYFTGRLLPSDEQAALYELL